MSFISKYLGLDISFCMMLPSSFCVMHFWPFWATWASVCLSLSLTLSYSMYNSRKSVTLTFKIHSDFNYSMRSYWQDFLCHLVAKEATQEELAFTFFYFTLFFSPSLLLSSDVQWFVCLSISLHWNITPGRPDTCLVYLYILRTWTSNDSN